MQNLANKLTAVAAVGVLAAIGSMMTPHYATAQAAPPTGSPGSAPVTIVSPIPLPVSQSGLWNVGITGPIVSLDSPGRHAYQATFENSGSLLFQSAVVPANHRLVLQQISVYTLLNNQFNPVPNDITIGIEPADGPHVGDPVFVFPVTPLPDDPKSSTLVAPLTAYVDAGRRIVIRLGHVPSGSFTASGTLSGYMVDCSLAACDALIP